MTDESILDKPIPSAPSRKPQSHRYPFWCPRFWHGMVLRDWLRLLVVNRLRVHPFRVPTALSITFFSAMNSLLALLQSALFGRRIGDTQVTQPPVFILGHWRCGTTYLHELMVLDDRLSYPTTYQCFAPHHFLLTEWCMVRFGGFLIPKRRPMDNVSSGWKRPQEDEFALCNLGAVTPYRRMAFPNEPPPDMNTLDMEGVAEADLRRWRRGLTRFVQSVTLRTGKRLVMKSPPHTGRIRTLAELFPGAKFVHIVRDPRSVIPSTIKLWKSLDDIQGLQLPHHRDLEPYIFDCFRRMYDGFHRQRDSVDSSQLYEVRYEDLVQDPVGQLERLYEHLDLGDFEPMRESLRRHFDRQTRYQVDRYELDEALKDRIDENCAEFSRRYGYS